MTRSHVNISLTSHALQRQVQALSCASLAQHTQHMLRPLTRDRHLGMHSEHSRIESVACIVESEERKWSMPIEPFKLPSSNLDSVFGRVCYEAS